MPLLVHADGAIEFPAAYSGVLGLFSHWTYSDREVQLASGDVLVLMTDGVLEAWDKEEEEFGYQRLIRLRAGQPQSGRSCHPPAYTRRCYRLLLEPFSG